MEGTHAEAVCEELQPMGRTHAGEVHGGLDPMLEQRKSVRSPPPREEGAAETTCDELTTAPLPHPPVPLGGRKWRTSRVKLSLGRREGRCF